jgi:hypothetical protein
MVALRDADAKISAAWLEVASGKKSPLHYHLTAKLLTPALLASYVGGTRFSVWWHCRPAAFARLSPERRAAYAKALRVTVEELGGIPAKPESLL